MGTCGLAMIVAASAGVLLAAALSVFLASDFESEFETAVVEAGFELVQLHRKIAASTGKQFFIK